MPNVNWNLEWLNHNSQRNYPLADTATRLDQSGNFELPDDFLVELDLPISAGMDVDPARFFIMNVGAFSTGFSVVVGYQPAEEDSTPVPVATALIARHNHTKGTKYNLGGRSPFEDTMGKVVIWQFDNIDNQPPGLWTFDFEATRLDPMAISPYIRGVSSLVAVNGNVRSQKLQGVVEIQAGANTQLVPIVASGQDPILVINFIDGEGTVDDCVCEGDAAPTTPITAINGVRGTSGGGFSIIGSDCMQIEAIANGIRLVNTCAKACCSCPELEKITDDLERLKVERVNVEDFVDRLGIAVDTMNLTVLGARLGDRSCVVCE
jgi:hypothetical protein